MRLDELCQRSEAQDPQQRELILSRTADGAVRIEVLYESETFGLPEP
jgi:hypothetical protein